MFERLNTRGEITEPLPLSCTRALPKPEQREFQDSMKGVHFVSSEMRIHLKKSESNFMQERDVMFMF